MNRNWMFGSMILVDITCWGGLIFFGIHWANCPFAGWHF